MFTRLLIRNFQKHKMRVIDLARITTIVGSTDKGKSSIVRALRWLCLNKKPGGKWIRKGAKGARVELTVEGHTVVRRQRPGKNTYALDKHVYAAVKTTVPEPVQKLLNVGPLNFQRQLDAHFWFSLPASQVSKQLNQIVNLGIIDTTLAAAGASVRRLKTVVEVCEGRLQDARQEKKDHTWTVEADRELREIEKLDQQREDLEAEIAGLESYLEQIANLKQTKIPDLTLVDAALTSLSKDHEKLDTLENEIAWLTDMVEEMRMTNADLKLIQIDLESLTVTLNSLEGEPCPVCGTPIQMKSLRF